ncbi:protein sickie-like [Condylostylus longicornis]|uniref:protein sickie-like n=1 Tax=Condylostylus longicornis TaxID=2530218 RepID=UPI00244DF38C|nr:protein sickie-like [Condylostylus longicornis]
MTTKRVSIMRPHTQIHDGFATIRKGGLTRTRSRAEQLERFRPKSLKSNSADFDEYTSNLYDDEDSNIISTSTNTDTGLSFLKGHYQSANGLIDPTTSEPLYSSPSSLPCSTFRPIGEQITQLPSSPQSNYTTVTQNIKKNSQFSLESLQSSTTPKTPDNPSEDGIFLYSAPESPQYTNILPGMNRSSNRSYDEIEDFITATNNMTNGQITSSPKSKSSIICDSILPPENEMIQLQDLTTTNKSKSIQPQTMEQETTPLNNNNIVRKSSMRSATLQPKKTSFSLFTSTIGESNSLATTNNTNDVKIDQNHLNNKFNGTTACNKNGTNTNTNIIYSNTINTYQHNRSASIPSSPKPNSCSTPLNTIFNTIEPKIKTSLEFYNPQTNYYSPSEISSKSSINSIHNSDISNSTREKSLFGGDYETINNSSINSNGINNSIPFKRSSSANIEDYSSYNTTQITTTTTPLSYLILPQQHQQHIKSNENLNINNSSHDRINYIGFENQTFKHRRYHTLGHPRLNSACTNNISFNNNNNNNGIDGSIFNNDIDSQHQRNFYQRTPMLSLMSNNSTGHLAATYGSGGSTTNVNNLPWNSSVTPIEDDINITDYIDPLVFKVGCQTTLRSKPIIPWYELAIKRDIRRKSCPPISQQNQAHVVAAFEQSLSNMTQRLQQLTATAERKDGELTDMRQTIELLRKQSIQAGLTTAHMQSMGVQQANVTSTNLQNQQQQKHQHQNKHTHGTNQSIPNGSPKHINGTSKTVNGNAVQNAHGTPNSSPSNLPSMQRHHSSDSMCSLNSLSSGGCSVQDKKKKKGWLRSSFTKAFSRNAKISKTSRHVAESQQSNQQHKNHSNPNEQNSPNHSIKANSKEQQQNGQQPKQQLQQQEQQNQKDKSNLTNLPPPSPSKNSPQKTVTIIENAKPVDAIELDGNPVVEDLKKQLREKDLVLTDIRLEALSSASQLESLKDTVMKMRAEMLTLKQNNERLQKLVTSRSLAGSEVSLGTAISPSGSIGESRRYSLADSSGRPPMELPKSLDEETEEENIPPAPAPEPPPPSSISPTTHIDLTPPPPAIEAPSPTQLKSTVLPLAIEDIPDMTDGKKISIAVYLGQPESFSKYLEEIYEIDNYYDCNNGLSKELDESSNNKENGFEVRKFSNANLNEIVIAYTYISGKTTWQNLDYIVRKTFKDYVARIDPGTNLGLNTDSITSYHLGEAKRGPEVGFPELLPCGYIIGNVKTLYICLQGVGSLSFDSLIPRSIVHRYITLLTEHRRLILCGPSGTGKSYLARKLAEFLVARSGRCNISEAIATFNVDHKSSKELRQYLSHIAEQASMPNGASELPSVIILDNLHHASALGDVFSSLLSAGPAAKLPCIIGTMSQATCNTTNLQLHHNFRWVLTANHMEPVKGFLGRFLRRRLFSLELQTQTHQNELSTVLTWLPTVWQHINRFLENHSSSDVTIGPRLFLTCPLDLKDSQVWFTDIWNYHLAPYLVEAVREGVQLYGRRGGAWNDPSTFIRDTYPWQYGPDSVPPLRQIMAEDVGLESTGVANPDSQDPLLNMLMRLQEAANYSETQEQESDCASLDSNITPDSSAGAE